MSQALYTPADISCHAQGAGRRTFVVLDGDPVVVRRVLEACGRPRSRTSDLRVYRTAPSRHFVAFDLPAYKAFIVRAWFKENAEAACLAWAPAD